MYEKKGHNKWEDRTQSVLLQYLIDFCAFLELAIEPSWLSNLSQKATNRIKIYSIINYKLWIKLG